MRAFGKADAFKDGALAEASTETEKRGERYILRHGRATHAKFEQRPVPIKEESVKPLEAMGEDFGCDTRKPDTVILLDRRGYRRAPITDEHMPLVARVGLRHLHGSPDAGEDSLYFLFIHWLARQFTHSEASG